MSQYGQLNQAQRIAFVSNIPTILGTGADKTNLPKEQIAIMQKDGSQICGTFAVTSAPDYDKSSVFKIVQGTGKSYNAAFQRAQIPVINPETVEFKAKQITGWRGIKAKHATKESKVAVGYDGVDLTKTLAAKLGQTIVFYVHLRGTPVDMLTGHTRGLDREYIIDPACLNECVCLDPCSAESCKYIQDELVRLIKEDKHNGIPITTLIDVSRITSCNPATPALVGLVNYTDYCVTQCDNGDGVALGLVQAQYPTKSISLKERQGSLSTYTFRQLTSAPAPAALSNAGLTAFPNCATCPSGYTYVARANTFEVSIPCGGTLPTITGVISSIKIDSNLSGDTYQVFVAVATPVATTEAEIATGCISGSFISVSRDICTLTTPSTQAWAACGTCAKAPRKFEITLGDTLCGTDRLAELQTTYPELVVAIKTTGTCIHVYETSVLSNCFENGCTEEEITWVAPAKFEGVAWKEIKPVVDASATCSCGIVLEGARFEQDVTDCDLDYFDYDPRMEGTVYIDITSHNHDYTSSICAGTETPVTVLQLPDMPVNNGRAVQWAEKESMSYFFKQRDASPVLRKLFGYNYNAKADVFYDEYQLTVEINALHGSYYTSEPYRITYRFFFPEGKGKQFEKAINGLVASTGLDNLSIVTL